MADEFKIIESQEQLDTVIKDRLARLSKQHTQEKGELQKKIDELTKINDDLTKKYSGYDTEIEGYKNKVSQLETDSLKRRIAYENGIPLELASRLTGANEEEIKADAQIIAKYAKGTTTAPPSRNEPTPEGSEKAVKNAAFAKMAKGLTGGNE